MIEQRVAPLLDHDQWQGKIYSNGWRTPGGGTAEVRDKATGASLGTTGIANAADVAAACARAKAAQPAWSATPGAERAAILLRAADILEAAIGAKPPSSLSTRRRSSSRRPMRSRASRCACRSASSA
jgi:delta 1-pyrroline-5-carboxylate dehydrogenase